MIDEREVLRSWLDLLTAANALKKSVDTRFRCEFGMSISRFDVMSALDRAGPEGLRAGALSQRLRVTEGNTTQVTAPLIREGLVKRSTDPEDKRGAVFRLTRKGEKLFARMATSHRQWIVDAFADFSEPQLKSLRRLLARLDAPGAVSDENKDAA